VWFDQLPLSDALNPMREIPVTQECVLAGGDDYELAFTAPAAKRASIQSLGKDLNLRLTLAGRITPEPGLSILNNGQPMTLSRTGFDHFGT
jgi:thiamine-monophosphate kinase